MPGPTRRAGVAALLGLTLLLSGCGTDSPPPEGPLVQDITGDASGAFDIDEVEAGEQLSLRATVAEVLSPGSFVVPPEDTAGRPLLVVSPTSVEPGEEVQLTGTLSLFDYEELVQSHELAPRERYAAHENELVLIADLVESDLPLDGK
jgi:hypothetical protein